MAERVPLDLLRLILRSPDIGDGWRQVSGKLWPLLDGIDTDLAETDLLRQRVRLTVRGTILAQRVT